MKNKCLLPALLVLFLTVSAQAATFVVTSIGDGADANTADPICQTATAGECTLRAAIQQANVSAGADEINFSIAPFDGTVKTITPLSVFPDITQTVTIDGYTQTGTSRNTLAVGNDAVLLIEINGGSQGTGDLFHLFADNNVVRGLIVNRAPFDGIFLGNPNGIPTTGNLVEGNFIGTNPTGTMDLGNGRYGVSLFFYPSINNLIGGVTPAVRNLISGNNQGGGVFGAGSSSNAVSGNYIGTTASGAAALGNGIRGVYAGNGASNNTIGGGAASERNVISGNSGTGVELLGSGLTNNDVRGNYIGIAADGIASLGNFGFGVGIGGTATGNTILSNLIFANQNLGINLGNSGVTPNDGGDADTGANNLQNFPALASVVKNGGSTTFQGTLNSTPNTNGFVIEFFTNAACDASGNGEGQRFVGSITVNTDNSGNAAFNQTFAITTASGEAATATATDPDGNTSEFSQCRTITGTQQTFIVTNTADTGAGSLRQAVTDANANNLATDTITFNIPGAGIRSIALLSPLPDITDPLVIDGYTQPGSSANTNPSAMGSNAVLLIELNGMNAGTGAGKDGLRLVSGNSTVRGLVINRFADDGINFVGNSDNNVIQGCFIGTNATGTIDFGNGSTGISGEVSHIGFTPNFNLIGGTIPAARNIISGNGGIGIEFTFAANNVIQGNFIGLAADGTTAIGNTGNGVVAGRLTGGTIIGGDDAADGTTDGIVAARNFISGNSQPGIFIGSASNPGITIMGNYIGTDITGTLARPNNGGIGTNVDNSSIIGGTTAGAGNLISGNTGIGINIGNSGNLIVRGNRIGTQADGVSPLGNTGNGVQIFAGGSNHRIGGAGAGDSNIIAFNAGDGVYIDSFLNAVSNPILGNSIFSNGGLGIDLGITGVTANDLDDADSGANNLQNFPVLSTVATTGGTTTVQGSLNSIPNTNFRVEFFVNPSCDPSFHGEGRLFVGALNTLTDAGGDSPVFSLPVGATPTSNVFTATATRLDAMLVPIETSEFSMCAQEADAPQTFVVNSNADDDDGDCSDAPGDCTLREAINRANANISADVINFNIAPGGTQTINVGAGGLPVIMNQARLDGTTQPGFSGSPPIELNGTGAGSGTDGLRIMAGGTTVTGFVINRFNGDGIEISANGGNIIAGNYIGTNAAGAADAGNVGNGIFVNGTIANRIGGTTVGERNVISGNDTRGIEFSNGTNANLVQGNYIGTNAAGTAGVPNFSGILINTGTHTVGGTAAEARNVISANFDGITIRNFGGTSVENVVQGNYIGTNAAGTAALGNLNAGIVVSNGTHFIGGATAGAGNVVSGNGAVGIIFINTNGSTAQGNFVGTNAAGTAAVPNGSGIEISNGSNTLIGGTNDGEKNTVAFNAGIGVFVRSGAGNRILSNSIFSNVGLGIDLGTVGVTANDGGDADTGANNLQNFPVIAFAQTGSTRVVGIFNSTPNQMFRLEFFNSPTADASGNGEGQTFIGSLNVTTDAMTGNAAFDQTFAPTAAIGSFISATATNLATGDTSEFSNAKQISIPTAASVTIGGRVLNQAGRGIFGAQIVMTDARGNARYATTNPFGYYRFTEVAAGETYIFMASHKRYEFPAQIVSVNEDRGDINFVAAPNK